MGGSAPAIRGPWPAGINNRANEKAIPTGAVRDSVNFDPSADGVMHLRSGFDLVVPGENIRGALGIGDHVLIADGTKLIDFNESIGSTAQLASIAGSGRFVGDVLNDELFFCTENQSFRYKNGALRPWGVPTVTLQPVPTLGAGSLAAGSYQCAATFIDAHGDEGGTTEALIIDVPANSSLGFILPSPPDGGKVRLYVSSVNGGTPYLQYEGVGAYICSVVMDSSARLDTQFLREPVTGDSITAHNGVLVIAAGSTLHMTLPMRPHLRSAMTGFFQFSKPIDMVMSCDGGIYLAADKTFFLTAIETPEPVSTKVLDFGAVRGSGARGIKKEAVWMTRYGVAMSDGQGGATLISEANFVPELASSGSSGVLEHNGNQLVVTTMHDPKGPNPLAASDYYEAEIFTP